MTWTAVENNLPSDGSYIQVWIDLCGHHITNRSYARYATYGPDGFRDGHAGHILDNVTHWQPEPDAPGSVDVYHQALLRAVAQHSKNEAFEQAANLHENINPASDVERLNGDPGAGAMGAVIEYRDAIRKLIQNV